MWSTFFVTDEEGHMVNAAAPGGMAAGPAGGAGQGAGGLANLMSGRSTFGGNKRRRATSAGHAMSEAQEGKVESLRASGFDVEKQRRHSVKRFWKI